MGFEIINQIKKEKGLTNSQISKLSGVTLSTLDKITSGVNKNPKLDTLLAICKVLGCSLNDFVDSPQTKTAPSLSDEAIQVAKEYSQLDAPGKRAVKVILKDQQTRMNERLPFPHRDNVIPLSRSIQKTSAGTGVYLGPEEMETIYVEDNALTRRASFCVPVSGDSMEPTYHDGDVLLVEGCEDIAVGQIGVFTVDGDGYVKKRGDRELISLNPSYPPVPMVENETWCNGLVIGVLDPAWVVDM